MPAATPIPRGPSVLTLYSAADLLTSRGCPVCRYTGETRQEPPGPEMTAWRRAAAFLDGAVFCGGPAR